MKVTVFSTKPYDRRFLQAANADARHELCFFEERLSRHTVVLQDEAPAVCIFVNDQCDAEVLAMLAERGCRLVALRCAGFNNVDLKAAEALGIKVARVPAYSPYAVAEHALAMILALNRKIHRAYNRVREGNFALDGLLGFDLHGKTVGILGTGKIGAILAGTLKAMGCRVLGYDPFPGPSFEAIGRYVALQELLAESDVISLHCPLTPKTHHVINAAAIAQMKPGVMLINTSRGGLIDTQAVIRGLKERQIGYLGLDVYEQEADLFFENLSETIIQDDYFQRLLTFPNVLITGHQAYFTETALQNIADATLGNVTSFERGERLANEVAAQAVALPAGEPATAKSEPPRR
jgi:D-lactate dehydrogenase